MECKEFQQLIKEQEVVKVEFDVFLEIFFSNGVSVEITADSEYDCPLLSFESSTEREAEKKRRELKQKASMKEKKGKEEFLKSLSKEQREELKKYHISYGK